MTQALLQADLGATTSFQIIEDLRKTAKAEDRRLEPDDIKSVLRATLIQVFCTQCCFYLTAGNYRSQKNTKCFFCYTRKYM